MLHTENHTCKSKADHYGMVISLICAIHCAAFPILFSIGLLESIQWTNHLMVDVLFFVASLIIAFYSLVRSYKNIHQSIYPIAIAGLGFALFSFSIFSHNHEYFMISVAAGLFIAAAHFYNHRLVNQVHG